jgi:hypothetical protein
MAGCIIVSVAFAAGTGYCMVMAKTTETKPKAEPQPFTFTLDPDQATELHFLLRRANREGKLEGELMELLQALNAHRFPTAKTAEG